MEAIGRSAVSAWIKDIYTIKLEGAYSFDALKLYVMREARDIQFDSDIHMKDVDTVSFKTSGYGGEGRG